MLSPWSTTYDMPRREGDKVRVLQLKASAQTVRQLRIPQAGHDGGGVVVPSFSPVRAGERVDVLMPTNDRRVAKMLVASGVVREVLGQASDGPRFVHIVIAPSHAHRLRRMIEMASRAPAHSAPPSQPSQPSPRSRPRDASGDSKFDSRPPGSSAPPAVFDEVSTLRVRGTSELLEVLRRPKSRNEGGSLDLAWRGARSSGQRVQVEVSFGPLADEIVLAGTVAHVRNDPRRSIPVAHIEVAVAHRHRLTYVVEVLNGIRDASTRAHRRVDVDIPGRWWAGANETFQRFGELSRGGTFVRTSRPPAVGSDVPLSFESPYLGPIRVPSQVVWISDEPGRAGFGARFRVSSRNLADKIGQLLEREASPHAAWA